MLYVVEVRMNRAAQWMRANMPAVRSATAAIYAAEAIAPDWYDVRVKVVR